MAPTKDLNDKSVLAADKEEKKQLVIEAIASQCSISAGFRALRDINVALKAGGTLEAHCLSGGKTNYSYKIFVKDSPDVALFAKLSFSYALWNPVKSVHYDLQRVQNEFYIMKRFSEIMGPNAPVATPYLCMDVGEDLKLLVAQWVPANEQFANQCIDGETDLRVVVKVAEAFATLNLTPVDPHFNDGVRPCLRSVFPQIIDLFEDFVNKNEGPEDACEALARQIGVEEFRRLIHNLETDYMRRDVLIHSDAHAFNILTEPRHHLDSAFGEDAAFYICDWELAYSGPKGRDVGVFMSWPMACGLAHAVQGRAKEAYNMLECVDTFWKTYAKHVATKGHKDDKYLLETFESALGWAGFFLFATFYQFQIFQDCLPLDGCPEYQVCASLGSMGAMGLKFLQLGCGDMGSSLSLRDLQAEVDSMLRDEMKYLLTVAGRRCTTNRLSLLRSTGRRISDASQLEEAVLRSALLSPRQTAFASSFSAGEMVAVKSDRRFSAQSQESLDFQSGIPSA